MTDPAVQVNVRILLAVVVVIVSVRLVGWVIAKIGQPRVLGEIVAGILLGPSLLGLLLPGVAGYLFPQPVVTALQTLAQLGLVMFMFLVGMELNIGTLRGQGRKIAVISQASILVPMLLAVPLALWLHPRLGAGADRLTFCLFLAAAMSITAFPVLARLLRETNLARTRVGSLSLVCAAINDVAAWILLAVVIAITQAAGPADAVLALALSALFVFVMVTVVRPLLARAGQLPMWSVLAVAILSSWITEQIGVHAVFGAFVAGAVMPRMQGWQRTVRRRLESVVSALLLPMFFVIVGLSTQVHKLTSAALWWLALVVVVVAIAGKLGGASIAARLTGAPWAEATTIGVLMNTRGLTEIVFLSIGLELGVISATMFTIMVVMALVTTFMAVPILRLMSVAAPAANEPVSDTVNR